MELDPSDLELLAQLLRRELGRVDRELEITRGSGDMYAIWLNQRWWQANDLLRKLGLPPYPPMAPSEAYDRRSTS